MVEHNSGRTIPMNKRLPRKELPLYKSIITAAALAYWHGNIVYADHF